jgi:L-alanine-DL-glutamate epimerase-like enolase superfamily enzyme
MARDAGEPLWRFCGGRPQVDVYASGGLYAQDKDRAALAAELAGYVAAGFTTVKMKVGALALDDDLRRVETARRAIGDAALVVDALSRLVRDDACEAVRRFADAGASAVQAPMALDDVDGLAVLAQASPVALWVGEASHDIGLFERLARLPRPPWLQFNPALAGGTRVTALAERLGRGARVTLQCHATAVLQAASLHLAGCTGAIAHAEFHMFHRHLHDLLPASARRVRDGRVTLGDEPGLGFDLPREDARLRRVASFQSGG